MNYPISRYLHVQSAFFPSFAGDGQSIAFISDLTGVPQVWQVPALGRRNVADGSIPWPRQLTFGEERIMGVWHAPADGRLVYARDAGGNEKAQLFLLQPETAREQALTKGHEEAMHLFGCWAGDGKAIFFAANRRHPAHFDVYRHDLAQGGTEMIWRHDEPGYLVDFTVGGDGRRLSFVRAPASFQNDLLELDLKRGEVRRLSPPDHVARYRQLAYAPDGLTLFLVTDLDSDYLHVRRLEPASRTWETLVAPNWDVELMALSPSGRYLAYTVNVEGNSRLELIDRARGAGLPGPELDDGPGVIGRNDRYLTFDPQSERLAFSYTAATRTHNVHVWELNDGEAYQVTRAGHGGLPRESFTTPELVHYPTFDEREIPAWFYKPAPENGDGWPVVVVVHGGPESQYRPTFNFLAQYLVHEGYAVLAPNVRGSTGYGKAYSHLDDVEKRMDSVADLAHAARWLGEQPHVDAARIAVYGGSYGGFMVLAALTNHPDLWAAGVNVVGISNFVSFLENTSDYRRGHREAEYGSLQNEREFLESIAPMRRIEELTAPLMVIHGANDPRVPLSEAQQLVEALKARDVPVEFLVFDDEGHGIIKRKNKLTAYPAVVEFLQRYV